jgi:hypothetical protein
VRGSPIRKSSDQRSVDSSPRLIAASYVLHRLLVPRHPPCALNNLATQKHRPSTPGRTSMSGPTQTLHTESEDARVHCAVLNVRPATPHMSPPDPPPHGDGGGTRSRRALTRSNGCPLPQDPTACLRTGPPCPPRSTPACAGRTSSDQEGRPNWSAFHPRAPPQEPAARRDDGPSRPGRGPGPLPAREAASAP